VQGTETSRGELPRLTIRAHECGKSGGILRMPAPRAALRHAVPVVLEAIVAPLGLFYLVLMLWGFRGALIAALGWSFLALGRRLQAAPGSVSGDQARRIVASFAEIERSAASGVALFTPRVVETGSFAKDGHASAQDWLGSLAGTSAAKAKARLAAAERAAADPKLTEALHESELSPDQLGVVATMANEVPEATESLLDLIDQGGSQQELSDTAARMRAAKRSRETERVRRARVHTQRHLRWHQDRDRRHPGRVLLRRGRLGPGGPGARKGGQGALEGGRLGGGESLAAHRIDAFIDMLAGSGGRGGRGRDAQGRDLGRHRRRRAAPGHDRR
jgi:hypothetical protein